MKAIYGYMTIVICLFSFFSCERDCIIVSDIQNIHIVVENDMLNVYPIFGKEDNCTYTVVYSLDEKEIGRVRNHPYELKYELQSDNLSVGDHFILIEFYGKHSEGLAGAYVERRFSAKYSIHEDGTTENICVEKIQ